MTLNIHKFKLKKQYNCIIKTFFKKLNYQTKHLGKDET